MVRAYDGDMFDDQYDPDDAATRADWERKDRRENPEMYPSQVGHTYGPDLSEEPPDGWTEGTSDDPPFKPDDLPF